LLEIMTIRRFIALAFTVLMLGVLSLAPVAFGQGASSGPSSPKPVNFGGAENVLALKSTLTSYHAPGGPESDGSSWYMLPVMNDGVRPAIRVLLAGQPPSAALHLLPRHTRPAILAVASSEAGVTVETAPAYGGRAWRVIIPPVTTAALAIRVASADAPPALSAWSEPALSSHNRQLAIFIAAVAALIGAAMLISGGLAILIGHTAPRWVSITLLLLLLSWLASSGMFDTLAPRLGGPYGLGAFLNLLALAAGAKLANAIVPLRDVFPRYQIYLRRVLWGLVALGLAAWVGLPGATLLGDIVIVTGGTVIAVYLFWCGRRGIKAAQVVAPSAAAFALVAMAGAVVALGGWGEGLTGPAVTGGFAAAGAILLALAVIASEEIAVLPFLHGSGAAKLLEARLPEGATLDPATPFANLALAAIGAAHQGVFDLDFRSQLLTLSPDAAQLLGRGYHETTLSHSDFQALINSDDRESYTNALTEFSAHPGSAFRAEFRVGAGQGRWRWLELRATIVTEQEDVASDCLGLLADITQRKEREALAEARDDLTGLGNRIAMMQALDGLGTDLSRSLFALIDIDRFKAIHASLGDEGADQVLRQTARRLGGLKARLFRAGGDSFALVFPEMPRDAKAAGDKAVEVCTPPHQVSGRSIFAPVSVGLARGSDGDDPLTLIKNAELALIAAKRQGGGAAMLYESDLDEVAPGDAVKLETELRQALEQGEIEVHYQPIMRMADASVAGFEALLRWRHATRGLVTPEDFIAHSEETGLIVELGRFALERAAADLSQWQRFFPLKPPLFVSVNLSRRQVRDAGFEGLLKTVLAANTIVAGTLHLEITESAVAADPRLVPMLERLRAAGAGLSIDDFGTGSSTLSQLRTLPFDTVKIDKSFLARHGGTDIDTDGEVVLASIVALAHDLKRAVVVEGVESQRDSDWLTGLKCEFGQGYYFSAPLKPEDALDFIARRYNPAAADDNP
jgi:diguanylate cyclase (GGDEF)-like protein/PAS domain S-box-containing protein